MRDVPHSSLIFALLSIVAAAGICFWLFVLGAAADRRLTVALGLIMAGALGNCYDRLALGHVRDFVHLHVDAIRFDCAIFNFADNMLVVGAVVLMLLALRPEPGDGVDEAPAEPGHGLSGDPGTGIADRPGSSGDRAVDHRSRSSRLTVARSAIRDVMGPGSGT